MSIVVYYLLNTSPEGAEPAWQPQCLPYSDAQMGEALQQCQRLRSDALPCACHDFVRAARHGRPRRRGGSGRWPHPGRRTLRLEQGRPRRAAGASRKHAQQPPVQRKDMDI
jgi:hypothetical protein